ncbi:hypothetical protein SAMN02799624_00428 [Paenibacillus sp. UNC496MF]|uniref:hypothetical protein n=1 Tax=Paenibacillus sp. UNC496MF TaxID=1502753 RepID=UPI0008E19DE8|nr:hypothetical protein [Paenibacillus sp. UNC496MF]SFI33477.1 hypothetical protein SAMN02799624_00428 [Paenibacillus sp. UNC496MF]
MRESANEGEGASCVVRRVGIVIEAGGDGVTAAIGAKTLRLPRDKVAADAKAGDAIVWTGSIWTVSERFGSIGTGYIKHEKSLMAPAPFNGADDPNPS